jgi:hypothetical protein
VRHYHLVLSNQQVSVPPIHPRDNIQGVVQRFIGIGEDLQSEVLIVHLLKEWLLYSILLFSLVHSGVDMRGEAMLLTRNIKSSKHFLMFSKAKARFPSKMNLLAFL